MVPHGKTNIKSEGEKMTKRNLILNFVLILLTICFFISGCGSKEVAVNVQKFDDLGNEDVKIAIGEPGSVPVGKYTVKVLDKLAKKDEILAERIHKNIVTEESNVRAVLDKVVTREVDAGFVYLTDAYQEEDKVEIINIPDNISLTPKYPIAVLKESEKKELAQLFVDYVTSKEGVEILKRYGFTPIIDDVKEFVPKSFENDTLIVYAAASMKETFEKMAENIKELTGANIKFKFASSGSLRQLIENGAAGGSEGADVFASANLDHMEGLKDNGFVEDFVLFTENKLVVVVPK